jgi:hypothetical protein
VRWVRDASGRFPRRPHYDPDELERTSADLLAEVRQLRGRDQSDAITTDDLTVLVERHAADLDLYADLSGEGADVEAVTDFLPGARPQVRIAERLSTEPRQVNRLRTTLAHELAHVVLHNFIWWFGSEGRPPDLDSERAIALSPRCGGRRKGTDWMEWQANYTAGALLMPADRLAELISAPVPRWVRSSAGRELVQVAQRRFAVSAQAASVRLQQLGYLSARPTVIVRAPLPRL